MRVQLTVVVDIHASPDAIELKTDHAQTAAVVALEAYGRVETVQRRRLGPELTWRRVERLAGTDIGR